MPLYVTCLAAGIALGNLMPRMAPKLDWPGSDQCLTLIAYVSLGLFYTMTFMNMQLWTVGGYLFFILVVIIVQVLLTVCYIYFFVFRAMGRDYEAAVISVGFAGIVLGSTARRWQSLQQSPGNMDAHTKPLLLYSWRVDSSLISSTPWRLHCFALYSILIHPDCTGATIRRLDSSNNPTIVIANPQSGCGNPGFTRP
jgi:Sodium/glutamate symporter